MLPISGEGCAFACIFRGLWPTDSILGRWFKIHPLSHFARSAFFGRTLIASFMAIGATAYSRGAVEADFSLVAALPGHHSHHWRPLSSETVTITSLIAGSTNQGTIPGAHFVAWSNPALKYWQAPRVTQLGSTYPIYMYGNPNGNVTGLYNGCPYFIEFVVAGTAFEIAARGNARYRLWIDDRLYSGPRTLVSAGVSGDVVTTKFTFASAGVRKIRYEAIDAFGGIRVENSASFIASTKTYPRWMCVGDSFDEGTGTYDGWLNGFVSSLGRKFGVAMVNSGSGATGYSTNGGIAGRYRYLDRLQDVTLNQPEVLFIDGTVNGYATITEAIAGSYYDAVKTVSPNTRIIVRGPTWATTSPPTAVLAARDAIAAACASRGIFFIDPLAAGRNWFSSQNSLAFYGTTSVPTASATVAGGSITAVNMGTSTSGWDVLERPAVTISGNGTGARATALMNYRLTAVEMLHRGGGYTEASAVVVGGGGSGMVLAPVIQDGEVTAVTIINAGSGFTSRPDIVISGDGAGAVASGFVSGSISGYTVTNGGSGYTTASVTVSVSGDGTHPKQNGHDFIAEKTLAALPYLDVQTIKFDALPDIEFTAEAIELAAQASSGLAVSFSVVSGPAAVAGNQLTLTGAGTVTMRAAQGGNDSYTAAATVDRTFNVTANFASWQRDNFTSLELANSAVSGPNAIYGVDGLTNLVKYALGLNPKTNIMSGLPEVATTATDWTYTYTRPAARSDVIYVVEVSTNLTTWITAGVSHDLVSTDAIAGTETWRARYPLTSAANAFFRLRVTR